MLLNDNLQLIELSQGQDIFSIGRNERDVTASSHRVPGSFDDKFILGLIHELTINCKYW